LDYKIQEPMKTFTPKTICQAAIDCFGKSLELATIKSERMFLSK